MFVGDKMPPGAAAKCRQERPGRLRMDELVRRLKGSRVVRLNARLFPPDDFEKSLFARYGVHPLEVEANDPDAIVDRTAGCDALCVVSTALPAPVMDALSRCRVISRYGIGTDKLAVDAATRRGIVVTNVPRFCDEEMGDHAMALLLAVARKLPQMGRAMATGSWLQARAQENASHRLAGRTLGLVGFGASARTTAERARGFGLRLLATRRRMQSVDPEAARLGVAMVDLDTLLARSDYVSLHLPLSADTFHLFDAARIARMKPGAVLINTARGALVDETALVAALREGRLAGAGIDTFEQINVHAETEEPPRHPLLELDNVVLTPHVAAHSAESKETWARTAVLNTLAVLGGYWPPPGHLVNPGVTPRAALAAWDERLFGD
jgi:phosphoglycerate dehydrogenase-like enzyme